MNQPRFCSALVLSILLLAGPLTGLAGADPIPSDFDHDSDVDLADFAEFQTCVLGPAIAQTDQVCSGARLDADEDVDSDDFGVLQGCLRGPDSPADLNCACPSDQTNCDGACVNTTSDNTNCGACGNVCAADTTCVSGSCEDVNGCGQGCPVGWVCFVGSCCNPTVSCCVDPCP